MDGQIADFLCRGEPEGLALLQQRYGGMVRYIVRGILPDAQDAEECVSDIYLRIWKRFSTYDSGKGSLAAWVTAVARNTAVDYRRGRRAPDRAWAEDAAASPPLEDEVLRRERVRELKAAIAALSASERELCYRRYYYLQSTAQIAAELGLSERAVEGRLYRLRGRLRGLIGGDAP